MVASDDISGQMQGERVEVESMTEGTNSTSTEDKGKGRAIDNQGEDDTVGGGEDITDDPQQEAALETTKQDLSLLANLDPTSVEDLVNLDSTPVKDLPTTTKLMKAITLLTSTVGAIHEFEPESGLPLSAFTDILELLTSTLSDVNESNPNMRSNPRSASPLQLAIARAKLSLPLENAVPPPTPSNAESGVAAIIGIAPNGAPVVISAASTPPQPPSETALLFAENARLALSALRPSSLFPPPVSAETNAPSRSLGSTPPPLGPSQMTKLPSELLLHILRIARNLSIEPTEQDVDSIKGQQDTWYRGGKTETRDAMGNPLNKISGSDAAAQRFSLGLARVCKRWVQPARAVAFENLHLHHHHHFAELLAHLTCTDSTLKHSVGHIKRICATLAPLPPADSNGRDGGGGGVSIAASVLHRIAGGRPTQFATRGGGGGPPRGMPRRIPGGSGSRRVGSAGGGGESSSSNGTKRLAVEGKSSAEMFSQIVEMADNVQDLKVVIVPPSVQRGFMGRIPTGTEFLDAAVLNTLSTTQTIRNLNLAFSIDFEELEMIFNGLPALENVKLRAIDALSGSTAVTSTAPHPANRIESFFIGNDDFNNPYGQEYTTLSDEQLCWLLEPSVSTLKELSLHLLVDPGNGGFFPPGMPRRGPGGGGASPPPFATTRFAALIENCGSNLEKLVLHDLSESGGVDPLFANPPYNGNFDHTLTSLPSLRELSLNWTYTGSSFLSSLSGLSTSLRRLTLSGTPQATSADAFADLVEHDLPKLEQLKVTGQFAGSRGQPGGWNGTGVRRVRQAAKDRGWPDALVG